MGHDELDAVVCALTGVLDEKLLLRENKLAITISDKVHDDRVDPSPPKVYVLMRQLPDDLRIVVRSKTIYDQAEMLEEVARE